MGTHDANPLAPSDTVFRAMTDDGSFRVVTARTDMTVREVVAAQRTLGAAAELFGELITGAILFRETMAPTLRVQCILDLPEDGGRLVADAHPDGGTRGLVVLPGEGSELPRTDGCLLRMARQLPHGRLQEGVVRVAADSGISGALMTYMQESEQVVSVVAVAVTAAGSGGVRAGGYMVQLLPEVDRAMLAVMTERLAEFPAMPELLARGLSARELAAEIFHRMPYTALDESEVRFQCRCSRERAQRALATLARDELRLAREEGRNLDTHCDFCNTTYRFDHEELDLILAGTTRVQ